LEIVSERSQSPRPQLIIPAAGAFGTGEHATTAMSLRLLERTTRSCAPGWRMLDAGTGTGILALAGVRFGAGLVLGLDNDPRAVAHARSNARLNHIHAAQFVRADVLGWRPNRRYDYITANLFSELLIAVLPIFRRALRANGRMIASGILREQAPAVIRALGRTGFCLEAKRRRGKWVALLAAAGKPS
jgi:ribosomal protein L11 methyltransferase